MITRFVPMFTIEVFSKQKTAPWHPKHPWHLARRLDGGHIVAFLHQGTATEVVALPIEANKNGFLDVKNKGHFFQKYDAEWDISISLIYIYILP